MAGAILTVNAGSSSLKFALYAVAGETLSPRFRGLIERLGEAPRLVVRDHAGTVVEETDWRAGDGPDQDAFAARLLGWVDAHLPVDRLEVVGHRVVHGGRDLVAPVRVDGRILAQIDALSPLAPLHQPHNAAAIRAIAAERPELAQIACFDSAFHHAMPPVATRFGLPRSLEAEGVRRYGFHGLSYEFIAGRLTTLAPDLAAGRVIAAHLGNGASLCAMTAGRSVDTTMGFTALDGLVMGTRCGSLDPGVILYLLQANGMDAASIEDLLYKRSGLLGVSGIASDMRTLIASDAESAREAIDLFVYRIAREAGGLTSALGGLDGIVFTAGIGENVPLVRSEVCTRLAWLGVNLDEAQNRGGKGRISAADSKVQVWVIPTDEEWMIATHARAFI